jgi:uncharacterized protein (DUF1919 family)
MKNLSNLEKKTSNLPFQDLICFLKRPRKIFQGLTTTTRHKNKVTHQNKIIRYNKAKQQGVIGE